MISHWKEATSLLDLSEYLCWRDRQTERVYDGIDHLHLPSFGGPKPNGLPSSIDCSPAVNYGTLFPYSWDETHVLVNPPYLDGMSDWRLMDRQTHRDRLIEIGMPNLAKRASAIILRVEFLAADLARAKDSRRQIVRDSLLAMIDSACQSFGRDAFIADTPFAIDTDAAIARSLLITARVPIDGLTWIAARHAVDVGIHIDDRLLDLIVRDLELSLRTRYLRHPPIPSVADQIRCAKKA